MISRRAFLKSAGQAALAGIAAPRLARSAIVPPRFEEVPAAASGIAWTHDNARSPARLLPESLGPGCAFLDYDNDGWMDIYLVNSGPSDFYKPAAPIGSALYKNNRDGTFTDVTTKAGVAGGTFGMGVAVGDYNNDGYPDLFVSAYGRPILYRNNGDGTFTDVTEKAGLAARGWTTSAVWFDYDNNGLLDLFVCSYVQYDLSQGGLACADRDRKDGHLIYHYCIPHLFKATTSALWRNNGDGTFTMVRDGVVDRALGKGLGVIATDVNNDGLLDLFVANDTAQNFLFLNHGRRGWQEVGLKAGVAFGPTGNARSGMGVDAADINGDGYDDLLVANIDHEMYSLYENHKGAFFTDAASDHGLAQATRLLSGWGAKFFDVDNDGYPDLLLANGHPDDVIALRAPEVQYLQPLLLFQHDGRRLRNVSGQAGPVFAKPLAARGLAAGDFDNDGRVDALVGCNGGQPVLLKNATANGNHWVGLALQGTSCNRDAIGARITWSAGGVKHSRLKHGGGSYLSSHDPREVLGLGTASSLDWVEIKWPLPSGRTERLTGIPIDRYVTIIEGRGVRK
jgi:hypothetical protein